MKKTQAKVIASALAGRTATVIGFIGSIFFLICFIVALATPEMSADVAVVIAVFVLLFILLIAKGKQITNSITRFKLYVFLISSQRITSIRGLANNTSQTLDFVKDDLQSMIDKKFFANAFIDHARDEIIVGGVSKPKHLAAPQTQPIHNHTQVEMEPYNCPGCGAPGIKVQKALIICAYCGTAFK